MKIGNISQPISRDISNTSTSSEQKLKEVAALYEKEFMRQLVKSMRATVQNSGLVTQNQAEKIFSEELYNHYSDLMADRGPQSLREHIYKNLVDKFGAQLGIHDKSLKPMGMMSLPVALQNSTRVKITQAPSEMQYRFIWDELRPNIEAMKVQAPFSGKVLSVNQFGDHSGMQIVMDHGYGLMSQMKFLGQPHVRVGDVLNEGQHMATLSEMGRELVWSLIHQGPRTSSD